jgi:sulfur transfer complex TusBCD TusB component (DsrH family)
MGLWIKLPPDEKTPCVAQWCLATGATGDAGRSAVDASEVISVEDTGKPSWEEAPLLLEMLTAREIVEHGKFTRYVLGDDIGGLWWNRDKVFELNGVLAVHEACTYDDIIDKAVELGRVYVLAEDVHARFGIDRRSVRTVADINESCIVRRPRRVGWPWEVVYSAVGAKSAKTRNRKREEQVTKDLQKAKEKAAKQKEIDDFVLAIQTCSTVLSVYCLAAIPELPWLRGYIMTGTDGRLATGNGVFSDLEQVLRSIRDLKISRRTLHAPLAEEIKHKIRSLGGLESRYLDQADEGCRSYLRNTLQAIKTAKWEEWRAFKPTGVRIRDDQEEWADRVTKELRRLC